LKTVFEKQAEITLGASNHFEQARRDLDEIVDKLAEIAETLNGYNVNLDFAKIELSKEASEAVTKLSQHLSEYKSLYFSTCDYLAIRNIFDICISEDTDFFAFRTHIVLCMKLQNFIQQFSLGAKFVEATCRRDLDILQKSKINLGKLLVWEKVVTSGLAKFISLFKEEKKQAVNDMPLFQLSELVTNCRDNFSNLEYLIDYRIALERLKSLGIDDYLEKVKEIDLRAEEIIPVFKKCFFRSWLDAIIPYYSAISEFRRLRQDERVEIFKDLDKSHLEISKAMLISKLTTRLPNFDAYSTNGEMALLRREMAKQRKLMPTRLLIAALPNLLPALKPCLMMSPLSVSTYLGNSPYEFDTVIFDEASQVRTEDAIGAIFRAKQAIIAGDSKQLPPTDFFNSTMSTSDEYEEDADGEANDAGAYESLLDEAIMLPTQTLLWHYRSRHEHLIAFSNTKIYRGSLITFPSSVEKIYGMGVEYAYVNGGIYDRGGKNGNKEEAEKVAEMVFKHFYDFPERSIGIIAFGEVQQSVILEALIAKRRVNPTFEPFFREDREESLFVKNLETVQGDERDTIIFSIGYAPDVSGKFIMNFGPLSRDGGERRLNVAITRARYNLKLVGSLLPTDIDVERTSGQGPKLLRLYIDYAMNGINTLLGETSSNNALWFDSPFESSVFDFLLSEGFKVETQVGCSGYRIDIAVRHPKYNGRYALGIECDGAMYHSARTARERDRLRQTVLEDMGWKIYRIWSTDWIKDRHTEGTRLLKAVKDAIDNYREIPPTSRTVSLNMTDYVKISTKTANERMKEGIKKKTKILQSRYYGCSAKNIPVADISNVMLLAISDNYGIVKSELFKEVAQFGYGWDRQGPVIKDKFERAYADLVKSNKIEEYQDCKIKINE